MNISSPAARFVLLLALLVVLPWKLFTRDGKGSQGTMISLLVLDDYLTDKPVGDALVKLFRDGELIISTYTDEDGKAFLDYATSVEEPEEPFAGNAFPNPTTGFTNVVFHALSSEAVDVSIFNLLGQTVTRRQERVTPGIYNIRSSLESLPPGIYFKQVVQGDRSRTYKIMKQQGGSGSSPSIGVDLINQKQDLYNKTTEEYAIAINRDDYDPKSFGVDVTSDLDLLKFMSRNNELKINAEDESNNPKTLNLLLDEEEINTPHRGIYKSGVFNIREVDESVLPLTFEIPSEDKDITFKEKEVGFLYPNNQAIPGLETIISNEPYNFQEGTKIIHVANQEYHVQISDPRLEEVDSLINFGETPLVNLNERITINYEPDTLDLSQQDFLELNLEEIINYYTAEDSSWVSTTGDAQIINGNKILPNNNSWSHELPITINALAQNGTHKELNTNIHIRPLTPRKFVKLYESDTNTEQPGYIILGNDTIFNEGTEIHTPAETIQTRLANPHNPELKWSFIRTTPVTQEDTLKAYHVDFYLRNMNNEIADSLYVQGHSPPEDSTKMAPERFQRFMNHTHFRARRNPLPGEYTGGFYDNTLNRWSSADNEFTPDTIKIYLEAYHRYVYDDDDNVISYEVSTMQQETIDYIYQVKQEGITPITQHEIPIKIEEHIDLDYRNNLHVVPENYNAVHICPDNTMQETIGWVGTVSVQASGEGVVKYGRVRLQTNPLPTQNPKVNKRVVYHELYSAIIYNSMARIRSENSDIATNYETIIGSPLHLDALVPTLYDKKAGRLIRQPRYEQGEPLENILLLTEEEMEQKQTPVAIDHSVLQEGFEK